MTGHRGLLVTEIFPPTHGGSGRWFWEIYRRLSRANYFIAAGTHAEAARFDAEHDLQLYRVLPHPRNWELIGREGLGAYWRGFRELNSLVSKHSITSLHCGRVLPEGVWGTALRWWRGVPFSCYVHGEDITGAKESREHTILVRQVLRSAKFIIVNSRNSARLLETEWSFPPEKIRLLHPGVDTDRFVPVERSADIRAGLGWGDRPVIVTVGRLTRRKGHDQMIRALSKIRERFPQMLYSIIGGGEERAYLEALVREENVGANVEFRGEPRDDEMIRCYQQCDLFALPNRQVGQDIEGFGMVLLEAQACGKPVLAGASGGTAETMNIPATGRVIPCETPQPIAEAVIKFLSDPRELAAMGQRARTWVVANFDWNSLSQQAESIFSQGFESGTPAS